MSPSIATGVFAVGIAGLFYWNRDSSVRTSRALWIPVIWFWILGSRAVSIWLGGQSTKTNASTMMEGSPLDAFVFQLLIAGGLAVVLYRARRCALLMKANWPILGYFLYCLFSVVCSDYPGVAAKRWIKASGDLVMALVVVTDFDPAAALRTLVSRVSFVLVPASRLLIKYYPYLGRGFDRWSGEAANTGVTTDKNYLGVTTYILALGIFWQVLRLWKDRRLPNRSGQLLAQGAVLGFAVWNLFTANSATSKACFLLGTILILLTSSERLRGRPKTVQAIVLTIILVGGLIKITGADDIVFQLLGRNDTLTGRTDIWQVLIPMAPNALVGAGFESFWLGPRLIKVWDAFPDLFVSEAHNGYLEVYLNLGAIGIILIIVILHHGYRRSIAAFRRDPGFGGLALAYVVSAALYSYTEAGFRMLDYSWSFLILVIIGASRVSLIRPTDCGRGKNVQTVVADDGNETEYRIEENIGVIPS